MSRKLNLFLKILLSICMAFCAVACISNLNVSYASGAKIIIKDASSIRYEDPTGIRFTAYASNDLFEDVETHVLKDGVVVGMYLVPVSYTDEGITEIDADTKGVKTVSSSNQTFYWALKSEISGYQQFDVVIYNIPEESYAEGIFARAFVEGGEYSGMSNTVKRSIAEVANAVLTADQLIEEDGEDKLDADRKETLNSYVPATTQLDTFRVIAYNGVASWDAVDGAVGYLVKTADGIVKTTETQYTLDTETEISVIAYGDGKTYTNSNVATAAVSEEGAFNVEDNQIATFNNASYENLITSLPASVHGSTGCTVVESAKYLSESECEGSNGGALDIVINQKAGAGRQSDFVLNLPKPIDMTDRNNISVRVKVYDTSYYTTRAADAKWYLRIFSSSSNGYSSGTTNELWAKEIPVIGEWVTLTWAGDSADLHDGQTTLTFSFISSSTYAPDLDGYVKLYIDDIGYYETLETPTNLVVSGTTLSWDAVANATGYVVDVNGTEIPVSSTSVDLASYLTGDVVIKVKATAVGYIASDYATKGMISLTGNQIATFNSAAYENMISTLPEGVQGSVGISKVVSATYVNESDCEGSNGGALNIVMKPIASGRSADFRVSFVNPIDATNYDGVEFRFKVYDTSFWTGTDSTSALKFKVLNTTGSQYATHSDARFVYDAAEGEWMTVKVSTANIAKCYVDDGYVLTIQVVMLGTYTVDYNGTCGIYLDDISYYTTDT